MKRRDLIGLIGMTALVGIAGCSSSGGSRDGDGASSGLDDVMLDGRRALDIKVIYFDFDDYTIRSEYHPVLRAHAQKLASSSKNITIEGHADERGTREYNIGLGERRANAIKRFLVAEGVAYSQISTISYGEENPAAYGHDEDSWAKNRRAVLDY